MAFCKGCGEEVEELVAVLVKGKRKKVCEDCADDINRDNAIEQESESVVQQMMGFKGRR
jgi:hypothetical protein